MDPTFLDGVAAFYSGPVFLCAMYGPAALVILTCFGVAAHSSGRGPWAEMLCSTTSWALALRCESANPRLERLFLHARLAPPVENYDGVAFQRINSTMCHQVQAQSSLHTCNGRRYVPLLLRHLRPLVDDD
eukprot:1624952-Amphidinium_carterae.2